MSATQIFLWILAGLALVFVANAGRRVWEALRDADSEWAWRREQGDAHALSLSQAQFRRAYFRAHGPRGQLYALGVGVACAIVATPALVLLAAVWRVGWIAGGRARDFGEGTLIWMFFMFFGLIAVWTGVSALAARRFHSRRPADLDEEIARAASAKPL